MYTSHIQCVCSVWFDSRVTWLTRCVDVSSTMQVREAMIDPCDRLRFTTRLFPHHDTNCMGIRNTFIDPQWHNNNFVFLAVKNRMPFRGQTTEVPQMTSPLHLYPQYGNTTQWSTQTLQHNWKTGKWILHTPFSSLRVSFAHYSNPGGLSTVWRGLI